MKKIIRLTESDLTRIVRQVLNEESDQKTQLMMKGLDDVMGGEESLENKIERSDVCNTCIKGIEGVETIAACKRLCERGRKKRQDVSDCVWGFANSKYGGSDNRFQLLYCLTKQFKLKLKKT